MTNRLFRTVTGGLNGLEKCFKKGNPILRYLNGEFYCFYIVHQTLIIMVAYLLAPKKLGGRRVVLAVLNYQLIAGITVIFWHSALLITFGIICIFSYNHPNLGY